MRWSLLFWGLWCLPGLGFSFWESGTGLGFRRPGFLKVWYGLDFVGSGIGLGL